MQKDDMSTADHAKVIAESYINGQRGQAVTQFKNAILEHCNSGALLEDIHSELSMVDYHGFTRLLIVNAYN